MLTFTPMSSLASPKFPSGARIRALVLAYFRATPPCVHQSAEALHVISLAHFLSAVSARRLDVYEEQQEPAASWPSLRSPCSRKSVSCRSLSCNRSSVSLNTLAAESDDDELLPSPVQARSSAFSSREVRLSVSQSLWAAG